MASSEKTEEIQFQTAYQGKELAEYVKEMFTFEHLHFRNGVFHFKYNEKLVKHYPPNVIYNYVRCAKSYPLHLDLIDLPAAYQVEDINLSKTNE